MIINNIRGYKILIKKYVLLLLLLFQTKIKKYSKKSYKGYKMEQIENGYKYDE